MKWNDGMGGGRGGRGGGSGGSSGTGLLGSLGTLQRYAITAGAALLATVIGYNSFWTYIKPNEMAVKESKFGGGIEEKVYTGGRMYFESFGVTFHRFPRDWQVLDFNNEEYEAGLEEKIPGYDHEPQLEIPSSDGFLNKFDITVVYRITNPAIVIQQGKGIGPGELYKGYVQQQTRAVLPETLGRMAAEQLYDPVLRLQHTEKALKLLNERLKPKGIEAREVLVRRFEYNKDYEKKIHDKVFQAQKEITNREQAKAEEKKAELSKVNAEGVASVEVEKQRATSEVTKIDADADNYKRTKDAFGQLLVEKAKAEGQQLVNRAYEGAGSERIVGIEMARKAGAIKKVYVKSCDQSGINPLDLSSVLRKFTR